MKYSTGNKGRNGYRRSGKRRVQGRRRRCRVRRFHQETKGPERDTVETQGIHVNIQGRIGRWLLKRQFG